MGLTLAQVVPWGRCLAEYRRMFSLSDSDLDRSILDCGGGPASFNAELTQIGGRVVSCDPVYQFTTAEIQQRIQATYAPIIEGVKANLDHYVWDEIGTPENLGRVRMAAMTQFLADFPTGLAAGRYVVGELPQLPWCDRSFDLALCSHLLFTYSDHLSLDLHLAGIRDLCRVASEVRIFPVLNLAGEVSPWLAPVMQTLTTAGYEVSLHTTDYEFQVGGNQFLLVRAD